MARGEDVRPLSIRDVEHATASDIVMRLIQAHKKHALAIEPTDDTNRYHAYGIFSAPQIRRQSGKCINVIDELAQSFSELESVLA